MNLLCIMLDAGEIDPKFMLNRYCGLEKWLIACTWIWNRNKYCWNIFHFSSTDKLIYKVRIVIYFATLPFALFSDWTKFAGIGMRFLLCCPLSLFLIFFCCRVVETHDDSAPQVDWGEQFDLEQWRFPGSEFILSTSSVIYRLNVLNVAWN